MGRTKLTILAACACLVGGMTLHDVWTHRFAAIYRDDRQILAASTQWSLDHNEAGDTQEYAYCTQIRPRQLSQAQLKDLTSSFQADLLAELKVITGGQNVAFPGMDVSQEFARDIVPGESFHDVDATLYQAGFRMEGAELFERDGKFFKLVSFENASNADDRKPWFSDPWFQYGFVIDVVSEEPENVFSACHTHAVFSGGNF